MTFKKPVIALLTLTILSCISSKKDPTVEHAAGVSIIGAMRNVMLKGDLQDRLSLDTIANKTGLYGLGPLSHLQGELLINDGKNYISRVTTNGSLEVKKSYDASAPFFVYSNVDKWEEIVLPDSIATIQDVEKYIGERTSKISSPFAFKLKGTVAHAKIHVLNLPEGAKVSSPAEAHENQVDYDIKNEKAEIIGFYSTEHKGVFTHHDSNTHMHLITADELKMGHLDELQIENMSLYLPEGHSQQ
ncbi:acetolactate decarboxylase [Salinimicrobium sp. MT39]|uniref:Alpha-acetolactate decarboxylase n=1 Tax=Salinimicrobium profundisediminis TaxID=2994553 RepID=A0A9X3I243_9FLAO|nr:acetolactate decarboxylase [Salinimicrobium profundisediminis]MCX2839631.1 acetolactate decarboxylase [Salinimicrobium profundisediminis]